VIRRIAPALPLVAAVALVLGAAAAPARVESVYSRGVYPGIAAALRALTMPFSLAFADVIPFVVAGLLVAAAVHLVRALRSRGLAALGPALSVTAVATGALALWFLLAWGINYRRLPLAHSLGLDVHPSEVGELLALAQELVQDANLAREGRAENGGVFALPQGRDETLRQAAAEGVRPKASRLSAALARLGISGIFVPFTGEPLVNDLLPDSELPWSAAHEVAHARGWAREDEANFLAFQACREHADPGFRYSAFLVASLYAVRALAEADPQAARPVSAQRSAAVRRDIEAVLAYQRRYEGRLADAGDRVNDLYLRAQGESRGVRSYGRMVDLMLAERRAARR
jgi:hypothetical protein